MARQFQMPGYLVVQGNAPALTTALRIARELRLEVIEIAIGAANIFDAAITLIDRTAACLRDSGVRHADAPRMAAILFQQTARRYAHSGKQGWGWWSQTPETLRIEKQIEAAGPQLGPVLRQLVLFGLDLFKKHAYVANALRKE